jgi:uncharacterized protein (DUF427 family)
MAQPASAADNAHDAIQPWAHDRSRYLIDFEPTPRRLRVTFGGETVADSRRAMLMLESKHLPVYYFPRADVRTELLEASQHSSTCPFKGEASYWSVRVGERVAEDAAWSYLEPRPEAAAIKDYMAFYWERMEHWYEEDEEVFVHARDPYKRVDVVDSSAHVRVMLGGEAIAESRRARFLFETGLPTRYYLLPEDVRMDLLAPTDKQSRCPYKGTASYWTARAGGQTYENIVWSYPEPIAECPRIKGYLCFFNEKVDDILVDGEPVPKVETPWS